MSSLIFGYDEMRAQIDAIEEEYGDEIAFVVGEHGHGNLTIEAETDDD